MEKEQKFICTVKRPCCDLCGKKAEKPVYFRFEDSWHLWFFSPRNTSTRSENAAPTATSLFNNCGRQTSLPLPSAGDQTSQRQSPTARGAPRDP